MSDELLKLVGIKKSFDDVVVLRGVDLSIGRGEFVTLLGSSGCGKTTLLRIIGGLETPDSGRVILSGEDVTDLAPNRRNVNTVFQNYALFPHMNVAQNVGYGLRLRRMDKKQIEKKVSEALELVQLSGYEKRMPTELSGGQRQRVAIARAVVVEPSVLLLDEPLGALDLQLRRQMQIELKRLQKRLGITFIYITHDQEEALNMSDRIAVMHGGYFEQIGTPAEVYDRPETAYVASFVGTANILNGKIRETDGNALTVDFEGGTGRACTREGIPSAIGDEICLAVRSEQIELGEPDTPFTIGATVKEKSFAGGMLRIAVEMPDGSELVASRHGIDSALAPGQRVGVGWKIDSAVMVRKEAVR